MSSKHPLMRAFFCRLFDTRLITRQKSKIAAIASISVTTLAFSPWAQATQSMLPSYEAEYLSTLEGYVAEAIKNNNALKKEDFSLKAEKAFLDSLEAQFYPSLSFVARASASEGGRTIDFPAGDLLNPIYNTLNDQSQQQGRGRPFPNVENQSIPLLRSFEQNTKLVVQGPLIAPELEAQVDAQRFKTEGLSLAKQQFQKQLITDVQTAFWQLTQARAQIIALEASLVTLKENERINQALYEAGQVTLDAPKRAQAERLNLEVSLNEAKLQARLSLQYLNLLRNQPSMAEAKTPSIAELQTNADLVRTSLAQSKINQQTALALQALSRNVSALDKLTEAARAGKKPDLNYQVEGGYQGESYSGGPNSGFATASVILNWKLLDAGTTQAEELKAANEALALQKERETVIQQLRLQQVQARENLQIALISIDAREQAAKAADESFRIASAKRDQGTISQVEFLSAEQLRTRSQIEFTNAVCQAHIAYAQWQNNNHALPKDTDRSSQ